MPNANLASASRVRAAVAALAMGSSLPLWAVEAPATVQVPTLAYDDRQIILVWEKPASHAEIAD
ncbi:hypothetical protein SB912_28280, partial [Pantoea sp. SIMBA_072]